LGPSDHARLLLGNCLLDSLLKFQGSFDIAHAAPLLSNPII
jgi:hypothetical protein